uniref:Family with sequence similarity 205 member C n=1 Tax=Rhinolophus ferrumequinum TaxID=59479 RepID=A0A671EJ65_RHIFE
MLSPIFVLWDIGYPLYTYGSIIIIALILWQVKKSPRELRLGPNRSRCRHHRRVKQNYRSSRARRLSWEEAEKPSELLSVMKSLEWFPQEGSVRRLLCADPCCQTCNAVALEIRQLLVGENSPISPRSPGPSQGSSCPEILSQHTQELSFPPAVSSMSQLMDQKSLTQSTAQSTDAVSIQDGRAEHKLRQELRALDVSWDAGALSSLSLKERRIPMNQQDKKSNSEYALEKQEATEAGLGNKMKHYPHWSNPEVKDQGHKESILLSKDETVAKTLAKTVEKSPPPTKGPVKQVKLEKTTEDEGSIFFDVPSA